MHCIILLTALAAVSGTPQFQRHDVDDFRDGYQATVADFNGDGRPDVAVLSIGRPEVVWYENPTWKKHTIAHTAANIDMAPYDIDGDGRPELVLASGFYFDNAAKGGDLQWLKPHKDFDRPWKLHPIAVDPVVHRVRWGDLDGDGRPELVHIPFFGPGSQGVKSPTPAHLWAFRLPAHPETDPWPVWKIDETLTMIHGGYVRDVDGDGRATIFTASREGIYSFKWEGQGAAAHWRKVHLGAGAMPAGDKPDAPRGSSEVAFGTLAKDRPFLAAIEPWHGNQVVVYLPPGKEAGKDALWTRRVLTSSFDEGHGLAVADLDGDGRDEIIAGCRGKGHCLMIYVPNADGDGFQPIEIDKTVAVDCTLVADVNGDGRPDLVVVAGRSNKVVWYENLGPKR
jgi:hypothetical protein